MRYIIITTEQIKSMKRSNYNYKSKKKKTTQTFDVLYI